jgi:hypothetical protein
MQAPGPTRAAAEGFRPVRLRRAEPPVTAFAVKPVREVGDDLSPDDLVLGVTVENESRAYPVPMLNAEFRRKVLNDTLAGRALAAVW